MSKSRPVPIRIPADVHDRLKEIAEEEERTVSQVMRRAFRIYIEAHDEEEI